jgi:hypothetical protein
VLLEAVGRGHNVMPIVVEDRFDVEGLAGLGLVKVSDAESGETRWLDTSSSSFSDAQKAALARQRHEREAAFQQAEAAPIHLGTDGDHLDALVAQSQLNKMAGDAHVY